MNNAYVEIANVVTKQVYSLLDDSEYTLHEILKDKNGDEWMGRLSKPLNKETFRALIGGKGLCQIFDGQIKVVLKNDEFVFIKRIVE